MIHLITLRFLTWWCATEHLFGMVSCSMHPLSQWLLLGMAYFGEKSRVQSGFVSTHLTNLPVGNQVSTFFFHFEQGSRGSRFERVDLQQRIPWSCCQERIPWSCCQDCCGKIAFLARRLEFRGLPARSDDDEAWGGWCRKRCQVRKRCSTVIRMWLGLHESFYLNIWIYRTLGWYWHRFILLRRSWSSFLNPIGSQGPRVQLHNQKRKQGPQYHNPFLRRTGPWLI